MTNMHSRTRPKALVGIGALLVTAALLLAGCSASTTSTSSNSDGHLLVWTDATRQPAAEAYAKAHSSEKITVVTVDGGNLESKLSLLARDPGSLPDVVFTPNGQGVEFAQKFGYSADLTKLVSSTVKKGFGATLSACTKDGALYCLPGDISTQMLFYNKALFDKFGYTVPTTWNEYAALGTKVASEHPGYVIGSCGDAFCPNIYYRASNCPGFKLSGQVDIKINVATDPDCTRVTKMLDPLIANKTVATLSPFDPDMATLGTDQKILMMPGFVWYGSLLFQQTFKNPSGVIAAAPLPNWGDGVKGVGAAIGGQWIVGAKSGNTTAAVKMIEALSTDSATLAKQVTFPAYAPAAKVWTADQAKTNFYAVDPTSTFTSARSDVTGNLYTPPGMDAITPFGNVVAPKLKSGSTLASQITAWAAAIGQTATDAGYTPTVSK
jgi:ABC-type glycerol-3-phosphate transport system substrate-binding protein